VNTRHAIVHRTAAAALVFASSTAQADDLWVSVNVRSDHYTRNQVAGNSSAFNRETLGVGAEWATTPQRSWLAGWYHNSHHKPSFYAGLAAQPIAYRAVKVGAAIGLVTGYPAGDVIPLLALIASYDGERYGANVVVAPPVAHFANGSISLQVKVKTDLLQ
jgi:hypothetical protein